MLSPPDMPRVARFALIPLVVGAVAIAIAVANTARRASDAVQRADPDPVIAAAGDIACDPATTEYEGGAGTTTACHQRATSDLLIRRGPDAVLPLGDNQYNCGGAAEYALSYDPTWGRLIAISHPIPGNHEYLTAEDEEGAGCPKTNEGQGYFTYFGKVAGRADRGYYSYDIGSWHLIALNSICEHVGGCVAGSPQEEWLRADLEAHPNLCTLAYWHHPRFASSALGNDDRTADFWVDLYAADAEIVLNGHFHAYERFAPQDPDQRPVATGPRQFTVGTGGSQMHPFADPPESTSEVRLNSAFGVLELTLRPTSYDWRFVGEDGTVLDSGSDTCH